MNSTIIVQILGIYMIIIGISLFLNKKLFKKIIKEMEDSYLLIFLSGMIALILGLIIILNINTISNISDIIILLLGLIITIKGTSLIIFPDFLKKSLSNFKSIIKYLPIFGAMYIILGLYLCYIGFVV